MSSRLTRTAVERLAENRIRAAIEAGELEGPPGTGRPIPGIDEPYDPLWWIRGWIARNDLEPYLHCQHRRR